jgi:hypothetical protein
MHSLGEQIRTPPVSWRRVLVLLLICVLLAAFLFSQASHLREYKLYFTEDRKPASLDLSALSEEWTESSLRERFAGFPIICQAYQGPLPVHRACAVDVKSANDVPALYVSFFFAGGRLDQVAIIVPWWAHGEAYASLVTSLGLPAASQLLPRDGVRLHGWRLNGGAAVFFNRDRPINPLLWNSIYWRSPSACRSGGCFRAKTQGQPTPQSIRPGQPS